MKYKTSAEKLDKKTKFESICFFIKIIRYKIAVKIKFHKLMLIFLILIFINTLG